MKKEKEEKDFDCVTKILMTIAIILGIVLIISIFMMIGQELIDVRLDQETADDVCQQLTGNSTAVASDNYVDGIDGGKLICTIPSFDSTQNIIVKSNN